jgi:AcrR family transcriptional regulator
MAPKVKTTKEAIIDAAVEIVRESGEQTLNARTVAARMGCSTQPVFSNFDSMQQLRLAVVEQADRLCRDYMQREIDSGIYPAYKASGMAYIRFAKEEKELFRLLYMRDRSEETYSPALDFGEEIETLVQQNTGLDAQTVKLFHLEIWACVHGIATMFATGFVDLPWELVSKMLTDVYQGLRKQYGLE